MTVVRALAKLTLSLRVTGVRADGFHLIDAEMVTIDLADDLAFSDGDGLFVDVVGGAAPVPTDDSNLVRRALRTVGRHRPGPAHQAHPGRAAGWAGARPTPPPCSGGRA